jgi:CubicO group peptidase (beta-lactamase class C family)
MKNKLSIAVLLLALYGCTLFSGNNNKPVEDDSLSYYPPTPGKMDKNEFRRYRRELAALIDSNLLNRNFNGSILVAKDGNILYEKYMGLKDLKTDSINAETPIHIASTSKTFTGIAVLRLVQQGKLSLEDSVQKFFPGLPYPGATVKMLLSHRSGIPNYVYFIPNSKWPKKQMVFNEDVLNFMLTEKPNPDFTAGTRFAYSNTNYVLLAMIVEKVTGMKFPDYMQQEIFKPLQMANTFVFTWNDSARVIHSYTSSGRIWDYDNLEGTYGDKNIFTTPRDLLKWDQALYTEQLVSKAMLDSAFTSYSNERPSVHNYGLGFRIMNLKNGKKIIYHNGRWHGFHSGFARLTDEKAVIIVLSNRQSWLPYHIGFKCYNIFGAYLPDENGNYDEEIEETDTIRTSPIKFQEIKIKRLMPGSKRKKLDKK